MLPRADLRRKSRAGGGRLGKVILQACKGALGCAARGRHKKVVGGGGMEGRSRLGKVVSSSSPTSQGGQTWQGSLKDTANYTSTGNISSFFFIQWGLIFLCSYSFSRRSNYFLSS